MLTYINEKSFPENIVTEEELLNVLEEIVLMAPIAQMISGDQLIRRHKNLHNRILGDGRTLCEFIACICSHKNRKYADRSSVFLRMFLKGPFVKSHHTEIEDSITFDNGICLKESSFDEASSLPSGSVMLSFKALEDPSPRFVINSSKFGRKVIPNFNKKNEIEKFIWKYERNPKHEITEDKSVKGKVHSAMELDDATAQLILTNGVKVGKSVFNFHEGQWYKFHCHNENKYHGFPISESTNYQDFVIARKILSSIGINKSGQILGDEYN